LGGEDPFRQQQLALAQALQAQSEGQGPSLAQAQLQAATDRNIAQQQGMMASQRGLGAGLAARLGSQNAANINQQAAGESAQLRSQEQLAARSQLGDALQQGRAGDIGVGDLRDSMQQYYQTALLNQSEQDRQAQIAKEGLISGNVIQQNQQRADAYNSAAQRRSGLVSSLGTALTGAAIKK